VTDISGMRYSQGMTKKDFLDEIIEEGTKKNPRFPEMVEAAYRRRVLLRELAAKREKAGITQKDVAAAMKTSQSAVARMERGEIDAKLSTVDRYAAAIGQRLEWRVKKA
jgi:ribosome-binding protein aMBF1 (putative translation factor)